MKSDALGDRMKAYENISRTYLTRRIPVIIRLDGKAFHTFTRGLEKPFDKILMSVMQQTMKRLCEEVQGCVFGYTQSDEITLVLTDYATIQTDAWFGYNIQKMTSVAASIATVEFNRILAEELSGAIEEYNEEWHSPPGRWEYLMQYEEKLFKATFDARCFSIPKEEVCNCLIWRQQDATRNSIEAVGQAHFSHTQLHGKSCNMIQEMLWSEHNIKMHLIRLYLMCLDILEKEEICTYREADRDFLLDIRRGKYQREDGTYRDEFFQMVNEYERRLNYAKQNTSLPRQPDYHAIEEFVMSVNGRAIDA